MLSRLTKKQILLGSAGALPTLHDRYGLSADAIVAKVKAELGSDFEPSTESRGAKETAPWRGEEVPPTA